MDDDIPPLLPPEETPPIRTQHHLYLHWRALMGPLGFSERLLWFGLLDDGGFMSPMLAQINDLPAYPDDELLVKLMEVFGGVLRAQADGGSVALLLSRPGPGQMTDSDRAWARGLVSAADRAGVPMRPVHLANDEELRVFGGDDLVVPRSA